MATEKQKLGEKGELRVIKSCYCPKCKKTDSRTLKRLPPNFKCADLVCDFCGYLAQVKSSNVKDVAILPKTVLGAAWSVQDERMQAGIYFPLFIVLFDTNNKSAIYYLSADLQTKELFTPRKPLSSSAKRAGWQGFYYDLTKLKPNSIVRLV